MSRILIVEDDAAHARLIQRALLAEGDPFEIQTAFTLASARAAIEASLPDLVIVDLLLPDGRGIDMLGVPSETPQGPFPLVIITSHGDERTAVEALKRGAMDYIVKSETGFADLPRLARRTISQWRLAEEKRAAEEAQRSSERRYRTLVDHAPIAILVACDDTIVMANNTAIRFLGAASENDVIGNRVDRFWEIADGSPLVPEPDGLSPDQLPTELIEQRFRRYDGRYFDVEVVRTKVDYYGRPAAQIVFQDITHRKRAELGLRIRDRAIASASDGIFIVQLAEDGPRIVDGNQAFSRIFGRDQESILRAGMALLKFDPRDHASEKRIGEAIEHGLSARETVRLPPRDENEIWVEISISPVQVVHGKTTHVVGVVHDISEKVAAEAEIRRRNAELAHFLRLTTMGEMVAGIAHEVNQPLYAISNYAGTCENLLRVGGEADIANVSSCVKKIGEQARRAGEIIRRLRNFVSHATPQVEMVGVLDLVSEAVALLGPLLKDQGVDVQIEVPNNLVEVVVDRVQIEQVLINLVTNAVDAMQSQSARREIEISAREVEGSSPDGEQGDPCVEITVRDYGEGLPSGIDIFEAFRSTKKGGMGMGLVISRTIVESHGGRIKAAPALGAGTLFSFTLPTSFNQVDGYVGDTNRVCD